MIKNALLIAAIGVLLSACPAVHADTVTADTNFIEKAYADLLQRSPSSAEIATGLTALGGESRFSFALSLDTSTAYYQLLANSYFQNLLGRPAGPSDLSLFVPLLSSTTDESVQALIVSSPEFFGDNGGTNAGFVTALFKDFLNRSPSLTELSLFENELATLTLTRDQVASLISGMQEYDADLVESYFLQFLRRPADTTGLNAFANALHGGSLTDEQVIASLIGSDEYFNLAQPSGSAQTPEPRPVALLALGLGALLLFRKQLG